MKRFHIGRYGFAWPLAIIFSLVFTILLASIGATTSYAQSKVELGRAASRDANGHVTIIILDMSGSMGQNDPQGYRCSAADAYIDLSGANDLIGVIGLDNNNGLTGGNHNFQTAQLWSNPVNMATVQARQALKNTIKTKSSNCRPDNTTPTYDALAQAYTMLASATKQSGFSGSVILLTDGTPYPDTDAQIAAIQSDLVPMYKAKNWHIDTIGLGADAPVGGSTPGTFHDFLSGISNATTGTFYDDGHGAVNGVSPLNIGPFFVQIFGRYSGLTVTQDIPPTALTGGTTSRNFQVTGGTTNLDVVVVKDQSRTQVALQDAAGQPVTADGVGVFVSQENYQDIFQVSQPQPGAWVANVTGSGQFLLYSLKQTNVGLQFAGLALKNSTIAITSVIPLGQPIVVKANLTENGQPVTDNSFSVNGTITYAGATSQYSQPFTLDDNATPGTYVGDVTVPMSAPAGTYNITLQASTVTLQNVASSVTQTVRMEIFPVPSFLSPQTGTLTDTAIQTTVIQWPWPLEKLYSWSALNWLSGWPLQGTPPEARTNLPGEVQWQEHAYAGAQISAMAYNDQQQSFPVTVNQDGQGAFTLQFVAPASGHYRVVFTTSGSYKDSHGDFGQTVRDVNVTVAPPTTRQLGIALFVTVLYILIVIFLFYLGKFLLTPRPFGEWIYDPGGENASGQRFNRAHRGPFQWFFRRNILTSQQAYMPSGLILRFSWGKQIEACSDGSPRAKDWHFSDGRPLRQTFQRVRELGFTMGEGEDGEGIARYLILPGDQGSGRSAGGSGGASRGNISNGRNPSSGRGGPKSPRSTGRDKKSSPPGRGKSNAPSWKDYYNV
jgi:archaellin